MPPRAPKDTDLFRRLYQSGGTAAVCAQWPDLTPSYARTWAHRHGISRRAFTVAEVRELVREVWPERPDAELLAAESGYSPSTIRSVAYELGYTSPDAPEPAETPKMRRHRERLEYIRAQVGRRAGEPGLYRALAEELGVAAEATVHWLARCAGVRLR